MTTIVLTKQSGSRFSAPELGSMMQRAWWSSEWQVEFLDGSRLTFSRTNWGRHELATDAAGHRIGEHTHQGWFKSQGPITWGGVDYDFTTHSQWKGSMTLVRHGEELARFAVDGWAHKVTLDTPNAAAVPPGLLLFCAWMTLMQRRDRAAASA